MNIALIHNYYQNAGGEDQIFAREGDLLESHGHRVFRYTCHNNDLRGQSAVKMAANTVWNRDQYRKLKALFRENEIEVAHFHNTFPIISPAGYYAAHAVGAVVIQNLQNYRMLCINASFVREGRVCEDCLGRGVPWPGVVHSCYRGSMGASAAVAANLVVHRVLGTWKTKIDAYIAPTEFVRRKMIEGGLPAEKIAVKPNFTHPDPGPGSGRGGYVLFVGRLDPLKGVDVLLAAHRLLGGDFPLKILGVGPLDPQVEAAARESPGLEWLGQKPVDEVLGLMGEARATVLPSIWFEGARGVISESFAKGTPVLSSDLGSNSTMIHDGRTGLLSRPGDPTDLAAKLDWVMTHPEELEVMRREARSEFEAKYTAERNYEFFMDIYAKAAPNAV